MKQNNAGARRGYDARHIALGFIASALYWTNEAALHAMLGLGTFVDGLVRPDPHEAWMRLPLIGVMVWMGFYSSSRVTALRRANEAIITERNKAQGYFNAAQVILLVLGADGKIIDINKAGCDVLGCEREAIIGKDWFENFLPERERNEVLSVFDNLLSGNAKAFENHENPVMTKGGERIIMCHNTLLTGATGEVRGTISAGMDVTERKKIEQELRQSLDDSERMNRLMVGRELKIVELKNEMVAMRARLKEFEAASINRRSARPASEYEQRQRNDKGSRG